MEHKKETRYKTELRLDKTVARKREEGIMIQRRTKNTRYLRRNDKLQSRKIIGNNRNN